MAKKVATFYKRDKNNAFHRQFILLIKFNNYIIYETNKWYNLYLFFYKNSKKITFKKVHFILKNRKIKC